MQHNFKKYPDFIPNKKSLAIVNVILASIPSQYHWITNPLGLKGDYDLGLQYLEEVIQSNSVYSEECKMLKAILNAFILNDDFAAIHILQDLYEQDTSNQLYNFVLSTLYFKNRHNDQALQLLKNRNQSSDYTLVPAYNYFLAEAQLNKLEYRKSISNYEEYLKGYNGKHHIQSSHFKLHTAYYLLNEKVLAKEHFNQINTTEKTITWPDQYAVDYAIRQEIPDTNLMKVRLLFDGGYYDQALQSLLKKDTYSTRKDSIEYTYRLARLYQFYHRKTDAITLYKKTISLSDYDDLWYFAPNSALQLGYIYEQKDNYTLAKKYFKEALKYKNHAYKQSLDDKAKRELKSLKYSE